MNRRKRREYSEEFKKQMVSLYNAGKSANEIMREYELTASTFHKWVKNYNQTGSFKAKENRSEEENQLRVLEKENKQLRMENDILIPIRVLEQAALIMGRR